jgi:hypothetical protein
MTLKTHDDSQRTLGKAYAGADNTVSYVDRFRVGHIWHGMKTDADGTLPFCISCALYLIRGRGARLGTPWRTWRPVRLLRRYAARPGL